MTLGSVFKGTNLNIHKKYQNGEQANITKERITRLGLIGFVWDPVNETWKVMYEELQEYAKIHHDCLVPRRYRGSGPQHLGSWVNFQHARYKSKNNNSKASTITDEIRNQTGRDGPCAHPACKVCAPPYLATILLSTSSIFSSRRTFSPIRRPNFVTWSRCEPAEHAVLYPAGGAIAPVNAHSSTFPPSGPLDALI